MRKRTSSKISASLCHERGAQDYDDHTGQFPVDDGADRGDLAVGQGRHLSAFQGLAPGDEFDGRIDREQSHDREERQLGDEGRAVEVVGRAYFEIEDPEQADSQHHARRHAENHIDEPQPPGGSEVELAPDQDEFDPQGGDQGEGREVVEKSEERSHLLGPHYSLAQIRVSTAIQFTSQILPPSSENDCSNRQEFEVMSEMTNRTRTTRPLRVSRLKNSPRPFANRPMAGGLIEPLPRPEKFRLHCRDCGSYRRRLSPSKCPAGPSTTSSTRLARPSQTFLTTVVPWYSTHVVEPVKGRSRRLKCVFHVPKWKSKSCWPLRCWDVADLPLSASVCANPACAWKARIRAHDRTTVRAAAACMTVLLEDGESPGFSGAEVTGCYFASSIAHRQGRPRSRSVSWGST